MLSRNKRLVPIYLALVFLPLSSPAQWQVISHDEVSAGIETNIAAIINQDGYTLEIYRDAVGAVRSRFNLKDGLLAFAEKSCPTYQIDRGQPQNRSLDQAPCLSNKRWAEFILGYIKDNVIASSSMLALMKGVEIRYRFKLRNGDYRETAFSLYGSRRALLAALGENIQVTTTR